MEHNSLVQGELVAVPERVIVAPSVGVFRPIDSEVAAVHIADTTHEAAEVELQEGQVIGTIEGPGATAPVKSPFRGRLVSMLAQPGERVREGQPVAWLRIA